jgi:hypothetical protein
MIPDDEIDGDKLVDTSVDAVKLNDGAGSGIDADLLDGQQGSVYLNTITTLSASSDITLTTTPTLIPGMTANFSTGTYLIIATVPFEISGSGGQFADFKIQLYKATVLQSGEAHDMDDLDAAGRNRKVTLAYAWSIVVTGTQALEIRAAIEVGATATVDTIWQLDKAFVIKIS